MKEDIDYQMRTIVENRGADQEGDKLLEILVSRIMWKMGFPLHTRGYQYTKEAIIMCVKDPDRIYLITKRLYPEIAKMHGTTTTAVEKAIRSSIGIFWEKGNRAIIREIFKYVEVNSKDGRPSNTEFIAQLSEQIRINNQYLL